MHSAREEILCFVMSILEFEKQEGVVGRTDVTPFGLAAGVLASDLANWPLLIGELEPDTCWFNSRNQAPVKTALGRVGNSARGRENSLAMIKHYSQPRSVRSPTGHLEIQY